MARFKKGSKEAKAYMAKIRKAKTGNTKKAKSVKKAKPVKKVAGLEKVVRKGKKTTVHYSRVSGVEDQLKRTIKNKIYVCQFITADQHKAKIKCSAYKEIGIHAVIIKLSKDRRPVYGVFVD